MDALQEQLVANLPPGLLDYVTAHNATYWAYFQRFLAVRAAFNDHFLTPFRVLILSPLVSRMTSSPDIATLALLVALLVISLKLLNMLYRTVLWWIRLVTRLIFWTALLSMALWLWQKGIDGAIADISVWGQEWTTNYQHFQAREMGAQNPPGAAARGSGSRGGWPGR